jgi:DNA-binding SARP family transcriptional activator
VTRSRPDGGHGTEPATAPADVGEGRLTVTLLGMVKASVEGRPAAVSSDRLRSVLAVLALSAGEVVPVDRLAAAVWGDDQPDDARRTVQLYMARLRGALGPDAIRTVPGGYLLDVEPDRVDARRFARLLETAARSTDQATERSRLVEALALWRGTPFSDLKSAWLTQVESTRLTDLYLAGVERLIDIDIASGRPHGVIAQLRELTAQYPLRERFWSQLMLALSHTHRRADALEAYQRLYRLLAGELGVAPGQAVQDLHQQILTTDAEAPGPRPRLAEPSPPPSAPLPLSVPVPVPVPRQLPADVAAFTGRVRELADLERLPDEKTVVTAAIDGMAGVGKTALAVHAAHQLAGRFPDGQIFIDLHGHTEGMSPVEPGDALDRMLRILGVPSTQIPRHLDEKAALFRSRQAGRTMLIVFDNAATEAQVAPLLPGAPGSLVLITGRRRLTGLDLTFTLSLDTLPQADAVTLFTRTAGAQRLAEATPAQVADVVDLCGRLPLAIRIAATRLRPHRTWTVARLVDRLREHQRRLAEFEAGPRGVGAALDLSYQRLATDQQRAYRLLGLHPGPDIDVHATAALTGTTSARARRLLDDLLEANLLQEQTPGRYRFHNLTRAHAAQTSETVDPEPDRRAALTRQLDHYAQTATMAMDLLYPVESEQRPRIPSPGGAVPAIREPEEAGAWLDTELPNLLAAAQYAVDQGWPDYTVHLAATIHRHLRAQEQYIDAETLHHQALDAVRSIGDRTGEVVALTDLGHIHRRQGNNTQAATDLEWALNIARGIGNERGQVHALNGLGRLRRRQGRHSMR